MAESVISRAARGRRVLADLQTVQFGQPTAGLLGVPLGEEQVAADVVQRNVVLRVVRPLPDIQGPDAVEHLLGTEVGPDAARHGRDVVHRDDRGGIVVHACTLRDGPDADFWQRHPCPAIERI